MKDIINRTCAEVSVLLRDIYSQHGRELADTSDLTADDIVAHGLRKVVPALDTAEMRRECLDRTIQADSELVHSAEALVNQWQQMAPEIQERLSAARLLYRQWIKQLEYRLNDAWLSTGADTLNSYGITDPLTKFEKGLAATDDARPLLKAVLRHNRGMRRFIAEEFRPDRRPRNEYEFECLLDEYIIPQQHSVFGCVPKDAKKMRSIEKQPSGNLLLQRIVHSAVFRLLDRIGNNMELGQIRHQTMCSSGLYASIDGSDCSNRIAYQWFEWFSFGSQLQTLVDATRVRFCDYGGEILRVNRLSSMGSYLTFCLMTLMFLAIARACSDSSSVFGDDILVLKKDMDITIRVLEAIGIVINHDKSFLGNYLVESCGCYVLNGEAILRYDFRWLYDEVDLIVTHNKLFNLCEAHQISDALSRKLRNIIEIIRGAIPSEYWGPVPSVATKELRPWLVIERHFHTPKLNRFFTKIWHQKIFKVSVFVREPAKRAAKNSRLSVMVRLHDIMRPTKADRRRVTIRSRTHLVDEHGNNYGLVNNDYGR